MAKVSGKMLNIDLDVVTDANGHQLIREGAQSFSGVKTFNAPPKSLMSKAEAENTAVTKAMLKNATRCVNEWFEETLTVTAEDIANGYILLSKEIPTGKESSLDASIVGAGPLVNGVEYGAETDRLVLTGYELERDIQVDDELAVRYMTCGEEVVTLPGIQEIVYSPELGRFVATCENYNSNTVEIYWSDDGKEWTKAYQKEHEIDRRYETDEYHGYIEIECLIWNTKLKRFSAVCLDTDYESFITGSWGLTSSDGKTWTEYESNGHAPHNINDGLYSCRAGDDGEFYRLDGYIYKSQDALTWTKVGDTPDDTNNADLNWVSGYFYYSTNNYYTLEQDTYSECIYSSKDCVSWQLLGSYTIDRETGEIIEGKDVRASPYGVYSPANGLYVYAYNGALDLSRDGRSWTECSTSVNFSLDGWYDGGWYDGINVFLGNANDGAVVLSRNGLVWWLLPGFELPRNRCWAANKDMMLTWTDDVIEVYEEFTSNIRGTAHTQIKVSQTGTWSVSSGNTGGGSTGGGGNTGGGGGGDGEPITLPDPDDDGFHHIPYPKFPGKP